MKNPGDRMDDVEQVSLLEHCLSTYFKINLRFFPNFEFPGGWILKDTVLTKATTPVYKHGNIVLQYGLQTLL
jgi:hypothetical protein